MNDEMEAARARAMIEKVKREISTVQYMTATMRGYSVEPGTQDVYADVHVPGDPDDISRQVAVLISDSIAPGQGVMIAYVPPEGAFLVAAIGAPAITSCRLTRNCTGAPDVDFAGDTYTVVPFCCEETRDGTALSVLSTGAGDSYVQVAAGGLYQISFSTSLEVLGALTTAVGLLTADVRVEEPITGSIWQVGTWRHLINTDYNSLDTAIVNQTFYVPPGGRVRAGVAHSVSVDSGLPSAADVRIGNDASVLSVAALGGRYVSPVLCGPGV